MIWKRKYEVAGEPEGRLRSYTEIRGSAIWNLARGNKDLIRNHSFWEIRVGYKARFWEESWQQRERLIQKDNLHVIHAFMSQSEATTVGNFWKPDEEGYWCNWKQKEDWEGAPETDRWSEYYTEMASCKVARKTGSDILRWGK